MTSLPQVPAATYRLQFSREFTFQQATELIPYLAELGVSHCYASPYLRARPGSLHGYDIIDHKSLNPEIGSPEEYEVFVAQLRRHSMGQILDIVPNHMGIMGSDNAWWLDVLENGQASQYAEFFDIDWHPIKAELHGKVLIPILEDQYGKVLESGAIKLRFDCETGEFSLFYYEHRFPFAPRTYPVVLTSSVEALQKKLGTAHVDVLELQSIATALANLPERHEVNPERIAERTRETDVQKRRLAALCRRSVEIGESIRQAIETLNGVAGDARSFDPLHELIKAQAYRLAQWRVAADDINYRRFFDINDLAALRQENDEVFAATHQYIFELVREGKVNGLRIDHPDGLYDPARYFQNLREGMQANRRAAKNAQYDYILVEKILTGNERLRKEWPVSGTTGYEFANLVNGLFIDRASEAKMDRIYRGFVGASIDFPDLVYSCKKLILKVALASELNVLATALSRIALSDRHTCDFTLNSLRSALAEIIASFPAYRTYISAESITEGDVGYIEQAIRAARRRSNAADLSVFDFIRRILLLQPDGDDFARHRARLLRFTMKFQQLTSAAMAKGLEDTAFYRYHRLTSLNDVGGDPARFGVTVAEFHRANQERMRDWPASMLSTSTHDSKRSEDVRARINVLSEIPALWRLTLRHWAEWNHASKRAVDGMPAPSANDEYLLYQTLVGAWPLNSPDPAEWEEFGGRIERYMTKALREAKFHTSWASPNSEYEGATADFIRSILREHPENRFLAAMREFQQRVSRLGMFNSISQTVLKLTSPGVPDIYQGTELWDFSLVDPDNRRPVDYAGRRRLLREMQSGRAAGDPAAFARGLLDSMEDGRIKLFVTSRTLCARKQRHELFEKGDYLPLAVRGARSDCVCSFARKRNGHLVVVVVPRLYASLLSGNTLNPLGREIWGDTCIKVPSAFAKRTFTNVYTGEHFPTHTGNAHAFSVSSLLSDFPVALLVSA